MKQLHKIFLVVITISFFNSCNTTDPKLEPELLLKLEDVSCTEAWLQLTTNNIQLPVTINLLKNNVQSKVFILNTQDSLLYIDSLLPNQTYKLQASSIQNPVSSNELSVTTMDTTSHNFTWQTFEFGQHSSSVLYDVAIINENNIWAVGEIYMNDSLGNPDPMAYNAVHWNGSSWEFKRIPTRTFAGTIVSSAIRTIFSFNENDIWTFSIAGSYSHYISGNWVTEFVNERDGSGNKLWGSSSSNLYLVCTNGGISHYNGSKWTKIESGTSVDLLDVWGSPNGTIWTCGYTNDYGTSSIIKIKNGVAEILFEGISNSKNNEYYVGPMSGVWSDNSYRIFLMTWQGIYLQKNNNKLFLEKEITGFSDVGLGIDGTGHNNVFAAGQRFVGHWNGYSYKEYPELFRQQRVFKNIKANATTVCAVGKDYNSPIYSNAVIVLGK